MKQTVKRVCGILMFLSINKTDGETEDEIARRKNP